MTLAITLVIISGFFHALWNVCAKKSFNKASFLFSAQIISFIIFTPLFLANLSHTAFTPQACALFLASMLAHGLYFTLLSRLYTIGDLSQVYPIIRGGSLFIIPLFGVIILNEHLSILGWIGVFMIISGIFFISEIRVSKLNYKILSLSLLAGLAIGLYILIDRLALNHTDPLTLNQIGTVGNIIAMMPFALKNRAKNLQQEWVKNYKSILIGAVLAPFSYMIFLWALSMAPISILAPMREIGTVFGALLGILFLKEPNGKSRIISSVIITVGMVLLSAFH